jgi:hypothetical protein
MLFREFNGFGNTRFPPQSSIRSQAIRVF